MFLPRLSLRARGRVGHAQCAHSVRTDGAVLYWWRSLSSCAQQSFALSVVLDKTPPHSCRMFRIEERWPCAACHNKRTIRWGTDVEHCFNCRSQWPRLKPKPTAIFSDAEMQRLVAYRGAVRAGVYTDELPGARRI